MFIFKIKMGRFLSTLKHEQPIFIWYRSAAHVLTSTYRIGLWNKEENLQMISRSWLYFLKSLDGRQYTSQVFFPKIYVMRANLLWPLVLHLVLQ
jgi:hypothetical protein